jgi:hypothetical protein
LYLLLLLLLLLLLFLSSPFSDFVFFYTHNVISLILCPLCQNDQYKRYPLKI